MNNRFAVVVIMFGCIMPHIVLSFGERTFFSTRSQSVNAVRDLVGWQQEINRFGIRQVCDEVTIYEESEPVSRPKTQSVAPQAAQEKSTGWFSWWRSAQPSAPVAQTPMVGESSIVEQSKIARTKMVCTDEDAMFTVFSITPEYSRSFGADRIAKTLFGTECLTFSGSRSGKRAATDILSDNFGLPSDFKSVVSFDPVVTNFLMDFGWYHGLDAWVPGLFYRVHMPVVHTKWDLKMHEKVLNPGVPFNSAEIALDSTVQPATYPAGYLAQDRILLNNTIPRTVTDAFQGKKVYGDMSNPLRYGKIFGRQTMTHAAELQAAVGYNFLRDWYHFGASIRVAAPTGNHSHAEFLFEPMVGNGGHCELGVGLTSHVQVWESDDAWHRLALYCDINVSHLFASRQRRSFDFTNNGPGSRYMLLTDNASPSQNLVVQSTTEPAANQYQRRLVPAINETTLESKISIGAQIDLVFKVAYQRDNLELDLGYNLWARSKEKIERCERFESGRFGIKGDAQVYGFNPADVPVPLNVTQSKATLNAGQNGGNNITALNGQNAYANLNADNPDLALDGSSNLLEALTAADNTALYGDAFIPVGVNLSNPVILLQDSDLNICSGLSPRAISHKIFTHVNYAWRDYEDYTPYLGAGVAGEWAQSSSCKNNGGAYSQWFLWLKGGLSY